MTTNSDWKRADLVPRPDPTKLTNEAIERVTAEYRREMVQLQKLLEMQVRNLSSLLDERYATQTKALDAAFVAAEKAVATALASAEKAVAKAEVANEIRFQGVNEFRQTLNDQASTFLSRQEYTAQHKALEDRVIASADRLSALELRLTSRLDLGAGQDTAQRTSQGDVRQLVTMAIMAVASLAAVITLIIVLATHK